MYIGRTQDRITVMLDQSSLDILAEEIGKAGAYACRMQKGIGRSFKADGSVLTEADMNISHTITSLVHHLFPEAAVISEEENADDRRDAEWVFILDPIDGTDVYSQGMPSFAVSLGILDRDRNPVGAYIAAPRFGIGEESMMVRLDPGSSPTLNGKPLTLSGNKDDVTEITMGSKGAIELDFSHFRGKVRVFGSTIIHILAPALYTSVEATVVQKCFAWDIASSHAVLRSLGMELSDTEGNIFRYTDDFLFGKEKLDRILYGGTEKARAYLRDNLPPR